MRIFPDDKIPNDPKDRRKIRVKAQYYQPAAGVRIYFRNFDVDDPSANSAPIDDETTPNAGDDNNGTVDGTTATRGGLLLVPPTGQPNPYDCEPFKNEEVSGVSCVTDSTGMTKVDFTTTMQPGDNFAVVASPEQAYVSGLTLADDGINLKDTADIQIPVTTEDFNACATTALRACRADMLTVWRRLHLEVDSMGNVGAANNITGTITNVRLGTDNTCNPPPPPAPPPVPPCYPAFTIYDVTTTAPLEVERFSNGRIVIGLNHYNVYGNGPALVALRGTPPLSRRVRLGSAFTIYDDDDYNEDANLLDGDSNENIVQLPESFKYLSAEDGIYPDGKPKNVYASAYIMPEYNWAQNVANYNQANVGFSLNVPIANLTTLINQNRNSSNDERNEFWISYFLIAYQGAINEDADGFNLNSQNQLVRDTSAPGITQGFGYIPCDCYQSGTCTGTSCLSVIPKGGFGSLIYQEIMQDVTRTWLRDATLTIQNQGVTVLHELGHQFGINGDNEPPQPTLPKRTINTYKVMDYINRPNESDYYEFHAEHLNLIRRRVSSPGEQ